VKKVQVTPSSYLGMRSVGQITQLLPLALLACPAAAPRPRSRCPAGNSIRASSCAHGDYSIHLGEELLAPGHLPLLAPGDPRKRPLLSHPQPPHAASLDVHAFYHVERLTQSFPSSAPGRPWSPSCPHPSHPSCRPYHFLWYRAGPGPCTSPHRTR